MNDYILAITVLVYGVTLYCLGYVKGVKQWH